MARHQTQDDEIRIDWEEMLSFWKRLEEREYRKNMSRLKNLIMLKKEIDAHSSSHETGLVLMNLPAPAMSWDQPQAKTMMYAELIEYLTEKLGRVL